MYQLNLIIIIKIKKYFIGPEELRGRQNEMDDDLNNRMHDMSLKSPGPGPRSNSPSFNQFRPQQPGYYPHSALHKASYSGMPPHRQQFSSQQPSGIPPLSSYMIFIYKLILKLKL